MWVEAGCKILDNNHSLIMHSHRSLYQTPRNEGGESDKNNL